MKSHWIKRIVRLLVLLFGVSILCFILTALSSTDPATYLVRRGNLSPTPEVIEQVRAELGLDQPLPIRYLNWIGGVFRGDFGESIFSTNEVAADLAAYFPQTLQLVFLSLAEIIVFSILLGVLCAAKKNKLTDYHADCFAVWNLCSSVLARFFAVDWLRCGNPDFQRNACIGDYGIDIAIHYLIFSCDLLDCTGISRFTAGRNAP